MAWTEVVQRSEWLAGNGYWVLATVQNSPGDLWYGIGGTRMGSSCFPRQVVLLRQRSFGESRRVALTAAVLTLAL